MWYIASFGLLGLAILNDWIVLLAIGNILIFLLLRPILKLKIKQYYVVNVLANLLLMQVLTFWFVFISPAGWLQKIGPLDTRVWLFIVILAVNTFSSLIFGLYSLLLKHVFTKQKYSLFSITTILTVSGWLMLAEIMRATTFSAGVHANSTPIRPVWGIFSSATLSQIPLLENIGTIFGFWGIGFLLPFAFICIFVSLYAVTKKQPIRIYIACLVGVAGLVTLSNNINIFQHKSSPLKILVISKNKKTEDYLPTLIKRLESRETNTNTVVAFPEYDNVIFPDVLVPGPLIDYDRINSVKKLNLTNVYFAGTRDAFWNDTRYAQNYLANSNFDFVQKKSKQFLVPGGEYVIGWVDTIFQQIDPDASLTFKKSRGRYVVPNSELEKETTKDAFANKVAIGACSDALVPGVFRSAIKNGADIIALNISYQQFSGTGQYERFANRHMQFISNSYQRPVVAGVGYGKAAIFDPNNSLTISIYGNITELDIPEKINTKTIYSELGDGYIVGFISIVTIGAVIYRQKRANRRTTKL